jgi:hypothetical protein
MRSPRFPVSEGAHHPRAASPARRSPAQGLPRRPLAEEVSVAIACRRGARGPGGGGCMLPISLSELAHAAAPAATLAWS